MRSQRALRETFYFFMSRKVRKVTQRLFKYYPLRSWRTLRETRCLQLCLAKFAMLRKDLFIISFAFLAGFARNLLSVIISRKVRYVTQRLVYYILCVLSGLCEKFLYVYLNSFGSWKHNIKQIIPPLSWNQFGDVIEQLHIASRKDQKFIRPFTLFQDPLCRPINRNDFTW